MKVSDFPKCCGARVLNGFWKQKLDARYGWLTDDLENTVAPEEVRSFLRDSEKYERAKGFFAVTLNQLQYDSLGDTFKEEGYDVVKRAWHEAHKNYIYLLVKVLNAEPPPKIETPEMRVFHAPPPPQEFDQDYLNQIARYNEYMEVTRRNAR